MKKALVTFALVLGMIPGASALSVRVAQAAEDVRIGVVDMQKALQTVEAGKKAKSQLEKDFNSRKKELQTEEASIKKMGEEFRKQSLVMSDEARGKKQNEIQERIMKFQELTQKSQGEIQQKEHELTEPIIAKLRSLISEVAKKRNMTVVLEKNDATVLYSLEKDDLTKEVVDLYNKGKS